LRYRYLKWGLDEMTAELGAVRRRQRPQGLGVRKLVERAKTNYAQLGRFWFFVYLLYPPIAVSLVQVYGSGRPWKGFEFPLFAFTSLLVPLIIVCACNAVERSGSVQGSRARYSGFPALFSLIWLGWALGGRNFTVVQPLADGSLFWRLKWVTEDLAPSIVFLGVSSIFAQMILFFFIPRDYDNDLDASLKGLERLRDEYKEWVWPVTFIFATFYLSGFSGFAKDSAPLGAEFILFWGLVGTGFLLAIARVYDHARGIRDLIETREAMDDILLQDENASSCTH